MKSKLLAHWLIKFDFCQLQWEFWTPCLSDKDYRRGSIVGIPALITFCWTSWIDLSARATIRAGSASVDLNFGVY